MRALFVIGRMLFGGFFVWSGLNHFLAADEFRDYAVGKGVPRADIGVPVSGALILAGGLSVMTGVSPRTGLAAIVGFLIPVSLQMHRFWEIEDPELRAQEMANFTKNMALAGAALTMMKIEEPWKPSLAELRGPDEEMYVRLGERELRALPA